MVDEQSAPSEAMSLDQTMAATDGPGLTTEPGEVEDDAETPERVGRFVVLGQLGAGGMGKVYTAIDPELERKVAVKVLHGRTGDGAVLLAEAQATAKLSHPNVVQIYEVGTHRDRVYMALEFVDGTTLLDWQREAKRGWLEVTEKYLQAGRGLAAAHEAGLVHRDFKPHNAIVGADGRVRVLDFGLARDRVAQEGRDDGPDEAQRRLDAMSGTPAYMAPEQHRGERAGPSADQFAFGISLYEALFGERPFGGDTRAAQAYNVLKGRRKQVPAGSDVPTWLRDVLSRALQVDPGERYSSMDALLAELEAGMNPPPPLWQRVAMPAALVAAMVGVVWVGATQDPGGEVCEGGSALVEEVWSEGRAEKIAEAFEASKAPFASDAWSRARVQLDARFATWAGEHRDNCEATRIRGSQSDARMDARAACLDDWLRDTSALLTVFEDADLEVIERAANAVESLEDPSECAKVDATPPEALPPAEAAEAVELARASLSALRAERIAGRPAEPARLEQALADAEATGWEPIAIDTAMEVAAHESLAGEHEAALERFEVAHYRNLALGRDAEAVKTALEAAALRGSRLKEYAPGLRWTSEAAALIERTGNDESRLAHLLSTRASIHMSHDDHALARADFEASLAKREVLGHELRAASTRVNLSQLLDEMDEYELAHQQAQRALDIRLERLGPDHPQVAFAQRQVATTLTRLERMEEADRMHAQSLATLERALGPQHPRVAFSHHRIGLLQGKQGKYEASIDSYRRAVEILEAHGGADNVQLIDPLVNLAGVLVRLDQIDEGETTIKRAIALAEKKNPESFKVAAATATLASIQKKQGDIEASVASNEKALAILIDKLGPDHTIVGDVHNNLALGLRKLDREKEARDHLQRSLDILTAKHGEHSVELVIPLNNLAASYGMLGQWDKAIELDERALALELAAKRPPAMRAKARHFLARSLWQSRKDRKRARALVAEGLAEIEGLDDAESNDRRERLKAWQADPSADER